MGETKVNFTAIKNDYSSTEMYNKDFNPNSESEAIHIAQEVHPVKYKSRPFDWFVCSVLGYILCPCTGICAIYYAVRANHAVDWERDEELISSHTSKAKCWTIASIAIGVALTIAFIVVMVVMVNHVQQQMAMIAKGLGQPHVPPQQAQQAYTG